jgi:excinuclease UvrABC helicase subunit UvrB
LRHAATTALLTRRDTIIVASVSCIYGIGSPDDYADMSITVKLGEKRKQDKFVRLLQISNIIATILIFIAAHSVFTAILSTFSRPVAM